MPKKPKYRPIWEVAEELHRLLVDRAMRETMKWLNRKPREKKTKL